MQLLKIIAKILTNQHTPNKYEPNHYNGTPHYGVVYIHEYPEQGWYLRITQPTATTIQIHQTPHYPQKLRPTVTLQLADPKLLSKINQLIRPTCTPCNSSQKSSTNKPPTNTNTTTTTSTPAPSPSTSTKEQTKTQTGTSASTKEHPQQ